MSSQRQKRPWLAAFLGTLATGLGHFYLRRWKRGLGWFAAAVATSVLFVPPEAARTLLDGGGDPATLAPVLIVGVASVADAYILARSRQRRSRAADARRAAAGGEDGHGDVDGATAETATSTGEKMTTDTDEKCPHCGKELDPDLDFCPWCTTRLTDGTQRTD